MISGGWRNLQACGWNCSLEHPAIYVDAERECCYIHGGKIAGARGAVSEDLFHIDLRRVGSSVDPGCFHFDHHWRRVTMVGSRNVNSTINTLPTSEAENERGTVGGAGVTIKNEPHTECRLPASRSGEPVNMITPRGRVIASHGPCLHSHVLFRHQSFLVLFGGRDAHGNVYNRLFAFHAASSAWEDLHGLFGGCSPPRMYGHAVTSLHYEDGVFAVAGVECTSSGVGVGGLKRARGGATPTKRPIGRPTNVDRASLCIFLLHMGDTQKGWTRVHSKNEGPCARHYFGLQASPSLSTLAQESSSASSLFLVGGKSGTLEFLDVWHFCFQTELWRELCVDPHPCMDAAQLSHPERRAARRKPLLKVFLVDRCDVEQSGTFLAASEGEAVNETVARLPVVLAVPRRKRFGGAMSPLPCTSRLQVVRTTPAEVSIASSAHTVSGSEYGVDIPLRCSASTLRYILVAAEPIADGEVRVRKQWLTRLSNHGQVDVLLLQQ